nr:hypothetical protein [Tanacetum cinerariifolium]
MSLLQEALDACTALTRRVEHLEYDKVAQALEIKKLKKRVKKLEKGNRVKVLKLRRLKRVGTSQRVDTSEDTVMDDASNQGMIIDEIDKDDDVTLMDDKEEDKKEEEAKVVEDDQKMSQLKYMRRRKGVVIKDPEEESTTSSIISAETKSKDKGKWIIVEEPNPLKKKQQVEMDEEYARKLHAELNKDINWDAAIDHVKQKVKEDPAVQNIKLDYFKRMSYNDIRPIFKVKFNSNMDSLLNTKEQMEEDENRALHRINETLAQKAAKRRKLNEEVENHKIHLEIVPDEDDDVYTEVTPFARKALWNLVKERFSTSKPKNFFDDFLLTTLGAMFKKPDGHAQVWRNESSIHGQAKVKSWKLLESCVRLRVEEESEMSLELLSAAKQKLMLLDSAAEGRLMMLNQVNAANIILLLSRQS